MITSTATISRGAEKFSMYILENIPMGTDKDKKYQCVIKRRARAEKRWMMMW